MDRFFLPEAALLIKEIVGAPNFIEVREATHWILLEEPELVSKTLIDFFGGSPSKLAGSAQEHGRAL